MQSISSSVRVLYYKLAKWDKKWTEAWKECPREERNILEKYAKMFLGNISKEPFPDKDKKVLRKHARNFIQFLDKVE